MPTNLLLSVSLKYWQDFQDTLAKAMDTNIYIFDANANPFPNSANKLKCVKM